MKRMMWVGAVALFLGVALVQDDQARGASLEIGVEPAEALVSVTGPEGYVSMIDISGGETLTGLHPGRYFVVATAPDHAIAQAEVELVGGASEALSLSLQAIERATQGAEQDQQHDGQDGMAQNGEQDDAAQAGDGDGGQADEGDGQAQDGGDGQPADGGEVAGGGQAGQQAQRGEEIFSQQCAQCHGQEGEGASGPALAGNQNLQDVETVVNQILQGGGGMPAFADQLSDEEIAAVATHEMSSWGNEFGEVSPDQVAGQRDGQQAGGGQQEGQQQEGQQQDGQQQEGQQQEGQQQEGQQQEGEQQAGQQQGQQATVEISVPAMSGAPVSVDVQIRIGDQAEEMRPRDQQGEQEQAGQREPQERQDQQAAQQEGQQQEEQQEAGQPDRQSDQQAGQEGAGDEVDQGTLQIAWVEPPGATVNVFGPDGFSREMQVVGGAVLPGLSAGTYRVTATMEGYQSASREVEVTAQEATTVDLTLQRQPAQQQDSQDRAPQDRDGQQRAAQEQDQQGEVGGGAQGEQQGEQIYAQQCAQCHGDQGEGVSAPALAENQQLQDIEAVIDQILHGGGGMPAFANQLSDEEIAAVATHELNSWGNGFGEVSADRVSQRRGGQQEGGGAQDGQDGQQQDGQQQDGQQQDGQQQDGQQQSQAAGWFSQDQARRGMEEYASHCAVCHGGGLEGRASYPPLVGEDFLANWQGRTASELFDYISKEMPQDRPGELGHLTYVLLTAYVLDQNGFPAGQTEFQPETGRAEGLVIDVRARGQEGEQEGAPPAPVGQETEQQQEEAE